MKYENGQEYLDEIGFIPIDNHTDPFQYLVDQIGFLRANNIFSIIEKRNSTNGKTQESDDIYQIKNKNLKISLAVTATFETKAILAICDYIIKHINLFHGTILDVGCDCGILACFIASECPECKVIGIDRCRKAIPNANELASRLGLTNVSFSCEDLESLRDEYDVVFSSRTLMCNVVPPETIFTDDAKSIAEIHRKEFGKYSCKLANAVKPNGFIVSIERLGINPGIWGWISAMHDSGLTVDKNSMRFIDANEAGGLSAVFFACIAKKENQPINPEELYRFMVFSRLSPNLQMYNSFFDAINMNYFYSGKIILGYHGYDVYGKLCYKHALYECVGDATTIIGDARLNKNVVCCRIENTKESIEQSINTICEDNKKLLHEKFVKKLFQINPEDGTELEVTEQFS